MRSSTLLLRADAGTAIGSGHVMRCLALAGEWQAQGGRAIFVSRCASAALRERIRAAGFVLEETACLHPDPADWKAMQAAIGRFQPEWVVLDGYHFTPDYQQAIRSQGCRLLVIDDMAHLPCYHADLLLNQNLSATPDLYARKLPIPRPTLDAQRSLLLGVKHALLRPEFQKWRSWQRVFPETARRVLVTFGGSDPDNITLQVLDALEQIEILDLEVRVIVGPANPHGEVLRQKTAKSVMNVRLLTDVKDMPEQMAWADVAVSGGGSACWELAFMGLPSVLIAIADNQAASVQAMHEQNLAVSATCPLSGNLDSLRDTLHSLIANREQRQTLSQSSHAHVDGRGAERVLAAMRQRGKEFVT